MAVCVGVIGVGVHGLQHVRLLSGLKDVELSGIYDTNQAETNRIASEFGTSAYAGLDELLSRVDCVIVAVPTSAHCEIVIECLSRGIPVLVEKPIAASVSEADEMIALAEKLGLPLAVGHIERFNSAYRSVMNTAAHPVFIESDRLAVFNPRGTDVAVVLDLMIHDIDIVLDMVRCPVVSVDAIGISVVSDEVDIANARVEFEDGAVANLTASRISQKRMRKIRTFQKNSYISMDFLTEESEVFELSPDIKPEGIAGALPQSMDGIIYSRFPNDGLNALELELSDFINAVKNGSKPRTSGRDGRKALEIASQVMENIDASMRRR